VESTALEAMRELDLMVIVPPNLSSRADALNEALTGTRIRIVIDRRRGERRCAYQAVAERRRSDRRAETRVLGYVLACPVVTTVMRPLASTS
jgi:hypothetical protein